MGDFEFYSRTSVDNDTEILQRIDDAEVVITHKTPLEDSVISRASQLKYISIMGTGYDVVDIDSANNHNIILTNVPTYAMDAVAQFTSSLLLEIIGQVGLHNQLVHDGKWSSVNNFTFWDKPLFELKCKTLGLIGYGRIAQKVAELANAFSMKVIFYNHRPSVATPKWVNQVSLDELFQKSDIISLHVVQSPETINLINKTTISKMKDGVILTNTARGKLISENDIAEALNNEKVYALATDVVQKEPIEKDNPLLKAKNCFITPHIAWAPLETRERLFRITVDNLNAYLSGKAKNVIN